MLHMFFYLRMLHQGFHRQLSLAGLERSLSRGGYGLDIPHCYTFLRVDVLWYRALTDQCLLLTPGAYHGGLQLFALLSSCSRPGSDISRLPTSCPRKTGTSSISCSNVYWELTLDIHVCDSARICLLICRGFESWAGSSMNGGRRICSWSCTTDTSYMGTGVWSSILTGTRELLRIKTISLSL